MEYKIIYMSALVTVVSLGGIVATLVKRFENRKLSDEALRNESALLQKTRNNAVTRADSPHVITFTRSPQYATKSPFSAVRWDGDAPIVRMNRQLQWYKLLSLDGVTTDQSIEFCKAIYRTKWKYAFVWHLLEVFARNGHPVGDTTMLKLIDMDTGKEIVIDSSPVTYANENSALGYELENEAAN